ncbi:hypothetical protein [Actinocorallia longicatena]|uniref:Terminase small subunit n=1 Tax=Actinocorallia longicatena TaxID=111803 RepID=A0ABP6QFT1_9ACTN
MAGAGPPPAEAGGKRRRNADVFEDQAVEVPRNSAVAKPPPLPYARKYLQATRAWYATWAAAPQAAAWVDTDWQRLHMLAPLVDAYWRHPTKELMAEIRINESLLGATHVDRLRGRIKFTAGQGPAPGGAAPRKVDDLTAQRRRRMTDAS